MGKYHFKLTKNETGEVIYDEDTDGIMSSVLCPGREARCLSTVSCGTLDYLQILLGLDFIKEDAFRGHAEIKELYTLYQNEIKTEKGDLKL